MAVAVRRHLPQPKALSESLEGGVEGLEGPGAATAIPEQRPRRVEGCELLRQFHELGRQVDDTLAAQAFGLVVRQNPGPDGGVEVRGSHLSYLAGASACVVQGDQEVLQAGMGSFNELLVAGGVEELIASAAACPRF